MFTSQYAPSEWGKYLSDEENCYSAISELNSEKVERGGAHVYPKSNQKMFWEWELIKWHSESLACPYGKIT